MAQADFAYQAANDAAGMVLGVSIFADRAHLREQIREDAEMAGFRNVGCAGIDALLGGAVRARFFDGDLFADPAWDMLLDLTAARVEHARVSVTSLCIASGEPPTTALRWISQMTEAGLLERVEDETDRRRAFIALTDRAADAMARYFAELGKGASRLG